MQDGWQDLGRKRISVLGDSEFLLESRPQPQPPIMARKTEAVKVWSCKTVRISSICLFGLGRVFSSNVGLPKFGPGV